MDWLHRRSSEVGGACKYFPARRFSNSLLLLTGNWPLQPWKGAGIWALFPAGESDSGEIPCIFPVDQGYCLRDEFAADWFLRQIRGGFLTGEEGMR